MTSALGKVPPVILNRKTIDSNERWLFLVDNQLRRLWRRPRRFLSQYLSEGAFAADLGCGPGFFTLTMAQIVGPAGRIFAVDSDEASIEVLDFKVSKHRYQNVDVRLSSAADLSFITDHSVDFVLADGLLCCMADPARGVQEIIRILKPSGLAYLSVAKSAWRENPTDVSRAEWRDVLNLFDVIKQGVSLTMMRWAIVSSKRTSS